MNIKSQRLNQSIDQSPVVRKYTHDSAWYKIGVTSVLVKINSKERCTTVLSIDNQEKVDGSHCRSCTRLVQKDIAFHLNGIDFLIFLYLSCLGVLNLLLKFGYRLTVIFKVSLK